MKTIKCKLRILYIKLGIYLIYIEVYIKLKYFKYLKNKIRKLKQ